MERAAIEAEAVRARTEDAREREAIKAAVEKALAEAMELAKAKASADALQDAKEAEENRKKELE